MVAGPDLAFRIPQVDGVPPAKPYSAVQHFMQIEMQEAVKAEAGEHAHQEYIYTEPAGKEAQCWLMCMRQYPLLFRERNLTGCTLGLTDTTAVQTRNKGSRKAQLRLLHCQRLKMQRKLSMHEHGEKSIAHETA